MELQNYYPLLLEKKILLSELGIHPRIYVAWKEEGLIFNEEELTISSEKKVKRKWVYLDIFEALWLLIIVELRKLNLDLKTIKKLKEFLKESPDYQDIFKSLSEADFQEKVVSRLSKEMLESIGGSTIKDKLSALLPSILKNEQSHFLNNIGALLNGIFIANTFPSIIIKLDKEAEDFDFIIAFNNHSEPKSKEELYRFYAETCSKSTYINLPIMTIVEQLFENVNLVTHCADYGFFTNQEMQLFEAIKNNDCEEIKIVKHQSGDYTINLSKTKAISGEDAKKLRRILGLKMYDRVEVVYRNESHLLIKNTTKKIVKK